MTSTIDDLEDELDLLDNPEESYKSHKGNYGAVSRRVQPPEMYHEPYGVGKLPDEVSLFIYDFFKYCLNGYEKILFYSYYINNMTLVEISEVLDMSYQKSDGEWVYKNCTFQYVGIQIKAIEKKMRKRWKTKDTWKVSAHDCK